MNFVVWPNDLTGDPGRPLHRKSLRAARRAMYRHSSDSGGVIHGYDRPLDYLERPGDVPGTIGGRGLVYQEVNGIVIYDERAP